MPDEFTEARPMDEHAEFVLSFVDDSRDDRKDLEDIWDETELNFLVRPPYDQPVGTATNAPLASTVAEIISHAPRRGFAVLKDPETHQQVMTIVAKIVLALFPPRRGFVSATGVGFEDTFRGQNVKKLLEYSYRKPGSFWSIVQWVLSMGVYGTGIVEDMWFYSEEPRNIRTVNIALDGTESAVDTIMEVPIWDDPRLEWKDVRDWFPDPSKPLISQMRGGAVRFTVSRRQAEQFADDGIWRPGAVEEAIRFQNRKDSREIEDKHGDETTGTDVRETHESFQDMIAYRYCGDIPWSPKDGFTRREIVVVNGETVRSKVWPRRLPWFECKAIPRFSSPWGVAPAEIIRYDQDFADTLKMMLADAVVRMTHPSPVVNKFANVDYERLRRPRPDYPVEVEGPPLQAIAWPDFNPPLAPAFQMWAGAKQHSREGSGALGAIQGLGLGSKRFSATEAASTFQQALDRPELFATVIEREFLPEMGKYRLELFQEFLDPTTDDLQRRVGESTLPVPLSTILADFDIEFVGSRQLSEQQEIEANREIIAMAANPLVSQLIPWIPFLRDHFKAIGKEEIAAMVGDPQMLQLHLLLTSVLGNTNQLSGNDNGTVPAQAPSGALPAQIAGGTA